MRDVIKLSKDEKAARALNILASEDRQTLQIGAITDPVTPAKSVGRKRTAEIQKKSTEISAKKKKEETPLQQIELTTFSQITKPRQLVNMKIKVLLLWYNKLYSQTRPKSITFIAIDIENSLFEIVIADKISEKWFSRIIEGKVYILKNLLSIENDKKLNMIETRFQMNITNDTKCIKLNKEQMETVAIPPVTTLANLHLVRPKENCLQNFVVYVIDVRPLSLRTQKKGDPSRYVEVYIIDQSLPTTATVLTVWDNIYDQYIDLFGHGFTKPFILTAIGLKVKDFRGRFTLAASNFTRFFSGPNANTIATKLHEWVTTNFQLKILSQKDLLDTKRLIPLTHPEQLMTIRQVKENTPDKLLENQVLKFVVHGMILDIDVDNQIHYDACDNCNKSPGDRSIANEACASCGKHPVKVVPRYLLTMTIGDSQDVMKVTAFDRDAQEILYMQVEKALQIRSQKNGHDELRRLAQRSLQSAYIFTLILNTQSLKFLHRSGYKVQMIDWIPRRCLPKPNSEAFQLQTFDAENTSPKSPCKDDDISSGASYIEVDSSSPSSSSFRKSK